jgi:small-conductance mechanosensitive channel
MTKSKSSYFKGIAMTAILALTLIPSIRQSSARAEPSAGTGASLDLATEERVLAKYFDDLVSYNKRTRELGKRARLVSTDLAEAQNQSEDLKRRLSEVQNAIRDIVSKLKAAGEWDSLDETILARITDARDKSYFQQNSFKKFLGENYDLSSYASELSSPLYNLRRKLTSRTASPSNDSLNVRAHHGSAPFTRAGLTCLIGNIQVGIIWRHNNVESSTHQNERICACSGGTAATCAGAAT